MDNILTLTNLMTDESRKTYRTKNPGTVWELEGTIRLKFKTIDALKDMGSNNSETYDQIIMRLIRAYGSEE